MFELDQAKAEHLCRQRPSWSVYQGKGEPAIADGAAAHLAVNLVDCDPYGEPWPALEAFFSSERPRPPVLGIAVNDGLRQKLRLQGGWSVRSLRQAVEKWGNAQMCEQYLMVCRWKLEQLAQRQDYRISHWTAYHCGHNDDMTHYAAIFERRVRAKSAARAAPKGRRPRPASRRRSAPPAP